MTVVISLAKDVTCHKLDFLFLKPEMTCIFEFWTEDEDWECEKAVRYSASTDWIWCVTPICIFANLNFYLVCMVGV